MAKLGQNFLTSPNIAKRIVELAEVEKNDTVLEIGPGKGILTEELIKKAEEVIAIEKDERLFENLKEKFSSITNLELINKDILDIKDSELPYTNYKIVANIPYYITGKILKKFLSSNYQPSDIILMVQKEVAERIVGQKNKKAKKQKSKIKNSVLSISVRAYGEPKIVKNVPAKHFIPKPKVDSVVLKISNISKNFFVGSVGSSASNRIDEEEFFEMIKKGFSQKRKMLKNNLNISGNILESCNIPEKSRPENLSLEDWDCLYKKIKNGRV